MISWRSNYINFNEIFDIPTSPSYKFTVERFMVESDKQGNIYIYSSVSPLSVLNNNDVLLKLKSQANNTIIGDENIKSFSYLLKYNSSFEYVSGLQIFINSAFDIATTSGSLIPGGWTPSENASVVISTNLVISNSENNTMYISGYGKLQNTSGNFKQDRLNNTTESSYIMKIKDNQVVQERDFYNNNVRITKIILNIS